MKYPPRRPGWLWICLSLAIGLLAAWSLVEATRAQAQASAVLTDLDRSAFPLVHARLAAYSPDGEFIAGMQTRNVTILEGGQSVPLSELQLERVGAQFATALTFGAGLALRDGAGVSRFEYLISGLQAWAERQAQSPADDISLLADGQPEQVHSLTRSAWLTSLAAAAPENMRQVEPSLQTLGRALIVAADPTPRPGMGRAVLFITPAQPAAAIAGLQSLAASARQQGVRVFVWLVASQEQADLPAGAALKQLALQTGGQFLLFTGSEALPDLDAYLEPLRNSYTLGYSSPLTSTGIYTVAAEITYGGLQARSPEVEFRLDLLPPNPVFVSLPSQIERSAVTVATAAPEAPAISELRPLSRELTILLEFPDGYRRQLVKTTLYINDAVAIENTQPPFDRFEWDLSEYNTSATYILRVEAMDSLGLTGSSIGFPVQVVVERPYQFLPVEITPRMVLVVLLAALVLGALTGLVLLLAGRLQPRLLGQRGRASSQVPTRPVQKPAAPAVPPAADTRPIPAQRLSNWMGQRSPRAGKSQPIAYLTPLEEGELQGSPIPLSDPETTFGRDAGQATWALDNACLDGLHARLLIENGEFRLFDAGSIAGTWVNFAEVPPEGALLEHGDLVHLGRIGFRFTRRDARQLRKTVILTRGQRL